MDKKELIKQYKQTIQPMGIYQVKNNKNGRIFIGSAKDLRGRINSNRFQLKTGAHFNKELQNDFNETGEQGFSFEVLDYLKPNEDADAGFDYTEELKVLEEMWLEKLQPYGEKGYNLKKNQGR
jgi:group I intron endonuclease